MRLDIQEINHKYITRMIIFSVFLFKNYRKNEGEYSRMICDYLRTKVKYTGDIKITCGPKYSLEEQREKSLESLFSDEGVEVLNLVVVQFKTALKEVNLQIDLSKEEKYESYLYS